MQVEFDYIVNLAKEYKQLNSSEDFLYDSLNKISQEEIAGTYDYYSDADKKYQPVNLLRSEIGRQLSTGRKINKSVVDEVKDKIRNKDSEYFSHLPEALLQQLEEYPKSERDLFASWQKAWNIFHVFFFRDKVRETVNLYLDKISSQLISDLHLPDYQAHSVDFYGPNNFGSDWCWIAIYPQNKLSHKDAYQFFVELSEKPRVGSVAGFAIKEQAVPDKLERVDTYADAVSVLTQQQTDIINLNNKIRGYYKFSPGSQASDWKFFYEANIFGIDFSNITIGDLRQYSTPEEVKIAMGLPSNSASNPAWAMWQIRSANIGDVVFANKGLNACVGIGIIEGEYYYAASENQYPHRRKVKWITDKEYQNQGNDKGVKNLFRPDTLTPTRNWEYLLKEYVRLYPELIPVFKENGLYLSEPTGINLPPAPVDDGAADTDEIEIKPVQYWWLNANPDIWKISSFAVGDTQTYTTHNDKGNKRRIYKHFQEVKPGDIVVGYETSPFKQIKAVYEITKGIYLNSSKEEIEIRLNEKLEVPVYWNDLKNNPGLQNCEVLKNNQGSLYKLTEEEYNIIREIIDLTNVATEKKEQEKKVYKFADDADKPFLSEQEFERITELLNRKKNIILQGPPGVGKTFIAKRIAYALMKEENDANIEMVQFHQSYSYEDFIQGLRPTTKGFELKDGVFYKFCLRAISHPERKFFFIIDEINRGNLSKIFGELLMLIESDKRSEKYKIKLTYAEDENDSFYVPSNLYIIGTMNTADRSLAIIDYALRRRFAFINLKPIYDTVFNTFLTSSGLSPSLVAHLSQNVPRVNKQIVDSLGEGFQIGHSYFCGYKNDGKSGADWWDEILQFELRPLLEEIWFDDLDKAGKMIGELQYKGQ